MKKRRFDSIKSFIMDVTDLVKRYITSKSSFPTGSKLLIEPVCCESVIDKPENSFGCLHFDLKQFIRKDRTGQLQPNAKAIYAVANRLYQ